MDSSEHHWLIQVRDGICALWLSAFVLFEGYTAAATALDHTRRFPHWESTLGWFLFVLPCELFVALPLLMDRERARLGFLLVTANLFVYALFMCLEVALAHEGLGRADIIGGGL